MSEREMVSADEAHVFAQVAERTGHGDSLTARLARTVIALHAIIEGRTTAPTDAEIDAHWQGGGMWLYAHRVVRCPVKAKRMAATHRQTASALRWVHLDASYRPCAWPVVAQRPAGCICDYPNGRHRFSCVRQQPTLAVTRDEDGTFRVAGKDVDRG